MGVLRLLLALSVIASHSGKILGSTMYPGGVAVQMFFMISGFYMALVLDGRYALTWSGIKLFYTNRALRLYPAFLAITGVIWLMFGVTWAMIGHQPGNNWVAVYGSMVWHQKLPVIITNWMMVGTDLLSNMFYDASHGVTWMFPSDPPMDHEGSAMWMHSLRTIGPAWSIGTEIWFYLLVPFLVCVHWRWLAAIFLASLGCRLWIAYGLGRYPYFFFPAQLLFFIAGIWALKIYRQWVEPNPRRIWYRVILYANWALVICYPWCSAWLPSPLLYTLFALSLPFIFKTTKQSTGDRLIGDLSYPVYLVHLLMLSLLARWFGINGNLAAVMSVLMAAAILVVVEKPIEKIRRRRVEAARPQATPTAV